MNYINSQEALEEFVARAKSSEVLAIDTEFLREKTYYPNLCLLQLATDDEVAIIDPFAIESLSAITPLLTNEGIVKLFHAGSQDLEILYRETGCLPKPIFDVQMAAAILGQSYQAGLASIISSFLGVSIKKSDSFTDWTRRPLADSQLRYAAEDVVYLPQLYRTMLASLVEKGRERWLDEDFARMSDAKNYEENPYERFRRLKRGNQLTRKQMAAAREVAAWREMQAMRRDVPRKWILTDEQVVEACRREASNIDELFMVRGVKQALSTRDAREVASLMKKAFASDESTWPKQAASLQCEANVDSAIDLMLALARVVSKETGIALQALASHSELAMLARGHVEECGLMKGWRREIIGNELLRLLEGRLFLGLNDNELVISEI